MDFIDFLKECSKSILFRIFMAIFGLSIIAGVLLLRDYYVVDAQRQPARELMAREWMRHHYPNRHGSASCPHRDCDAMIDGIAPFELRCEDDKCEPLHRNNYAN